MVVLVFYLEGYPSYAWFYATCQSRYSEKNPIGTYIAMLV